MTRILRNGVGQEEPGAVPLVVPAGVENARLSLPEQLAATGRQLVERVPSDPLAAKPSLFRHAGEDRAHAPFGEAEGLQQRDEAAHPHGFGVREQIFAEKREDQVLRALRDQRPSEIHRYTARTFIGNQSSYRSQDAY